MSLDDLRKRGCWPQQKPGVPTSSHGWLVQSTQDALAKRLNASTRVVLELGAWLGKSTRFILDNAPNAHVISVDLWDDSMIRPWILSRHPRLMPVVDAGVRETYLANQWEWRDRLTPLQMHSHAAVDLVGDLGVLPDVVFLDTSHGYQDTLNEVKRITSAFPTAVLVGDDWEWTTGRSAKRSGENWGCPVARAVQAFVEENPRWVCDAAGNGWSLKVR